MVPTVGTTAACHFTRNVIRKHKVTDTLATMMLKKLPMHVKVPSERLLLEMEDLLKMNNVVSPQVHKFNILCFSTLIHRTFMHQHSEVVNPLLNRYLHRFLEHVKSKSRETSVTSGLQIMRFALTLRLSILGGSRKLRARSVCFTESA